MKKIGILIAVMLGIVVIAGCGNKEGKEAYEEFKERYAVDFDDSNKLDEWPISIYKLNGSFYVKSIEKNKYDHYYSWEIGMLPSEGTKHKTKNEFNEAVRGTEPLYEQNMK